MKNSEKTLEKFSFYDSIHNLPIRAWFDIHKTGEFRLLLKEDCYTNEEKINKLFQTWESIYNEYIDIFGLSEEFLEDLNQQVELANYKADFVITGNKYLKTMIKIHEDKFNSEKKAESKEIELEILLARMSKYYGFKLESKELTVVQYYSYLNTVKNG